MKSPSNQKFQTKATKVLPENYHQIRKISMQINTWLGIFLNLMSLVVLLIASAVAFSLVLVFRPESLSLPREFVFDLRGGLILIAWVLGLSIVMIIVHEALHGFFFRIVTHEPVKYAFKGAYAYAAAPDWYFPRHNYIYSCLAPLVGISLICWILLLIAPQSWLLPVCYVLVSNAAGATADIYIAAVQCKYPPETLYQDEGDVFSIYQPKTKVVVSS